jgi:fumarate reductase subunit C
MTERKEKPVYTEYHPRWYRPRMSTYWWVKRWSHMAFILRELSSIFVAWSVVYILAMLGAMYDPTRYRAFLAWSARPVVVLVNVISLGFVLFHAITWFNLAPRAMVVRVGGKRVPPVLIAGSNYAAWVVVTAVVAVLVLGS